MQRYKNLAGNSGVATFEMGANFIKVKFIEGHSYRYTYKSAGKVHVDQMKILAAEGRGLSGYISQHVKDKYASRDGGDEIG